MCGCNLIYAGSVLAEGSCDLLPERKSTPTFTDALLVSLRPHCTRIHPSFVHVVTCVQLVSRLRGHVSSKYPLHAICSDAMCYQQCPMQFVLHSSLLFQCARPSPSSPSPLLDAGCVLVEGSCEQQVPAGCCVYPSGVRGSSGQAAGHAAGTAATGYSSSR